MSRAFFIAPHYVKAIEAFLGWVISKPSVNDWGCHMLAKRTLESLKIVHLDIISVESHVS
jgi:hypothetical protein